MNLIKKIIVAATLSTLSLGYLTTAQAADTVKPLQGISFHTETKDAVAYYLADKGTCKVVLMLTDKTAYAPARFDDVVEANKSTLRHVDDGKSLEFACGPDAQAMTINMLATVADKQ
jgi:hypothetical protein